MISAFLVLLCFCFNSVIAFTCSYNLATVKVPYYVPFLVNGPTCDEVVRTFALTGDLPKGLKFQYNVGAFSGVSTVSEWSPLNVTITVISIPGNTLTLSLQFVGALAENKVNGWSGYWIPTTDSQYKNDILNRFMSGTMPFTYTHYDVRGYPIYDCKSGTTCIVSDGIPFENTYTVWITSFKSKLIMEMAVSCNSNCAIYVDSLTTPLPISIYGSVSGNFLDGDHYIILILLNKVSAALSVNDFGSPTLFKIPTSSLPYPLQTFEYRTKDLILVKGLFQTLTPIIVGYTVQITSDPVLPSGMSLTKVGQINGSPQNVSSPQLYTIYANSPEGYNLTQIISIQTVDNTYDKMAKGLDGLYYSSINRQIPWRLPDSTDTLRFRRIDVLINHVQPDPFFWDGLNGDFFNSFTIDWSGLLYITTPGTYTFILHTNGGGRFEINGLILTTEGNGVGKAEGTVKLPMGLIQIKLYYWKTSKDTVKQLYLEYSSESQPLVTIPDIQFVHIPRYTFSYTYETASYLKNVAIVNNCPIWTQVIPTQYTKFEVSPPLPKGLTVVQETGCIHGTIIATEPSLNPTYFTIVSSGVPTLPTYQSRVTISFETLSPPTLIQYTPINANIGQKVTSRPAILGEDYTVQLVSDLPSGLRINTANGEISGIPTESYSGEIKVEVVNAAGKINGTVSITIKGCESGFVFVHLEYKTGKGDGLTMSLVSGDVVLTYKSDHEDYSQYTFYVCSPTPSISLTFVLPEGKGGTYFLFSEKNYLLKYGEYISGSVQKIDAAVIVNLPPIVEYVTTINFASGETFSFIPTIKQSAVTGFTSSTLLEGLHLDPVTGVISGSVTNTENRDGIITIVSHNDLLESQSNIAYTQTSGCLNAQVLLSIDTSSGISGPVMYFRISTVTDQEIYSVNSVEPNRHNTYAKCVNKGNYKVVYGSNDNSNWDINTFFVIKNRDAVVSKILYDQSPKPGTFLFSLSIEIPSSSEWFYSSTFLANWNTVESVTWLTAKPGNFARPNTVSYYRLSLEITDLSEFERFDCRLSYDAGVVGYINGVEFYRKNMPVGPITENSFALKNNTDDFYIYGLINLFQSGSNIVAFETHKTSSMITTTDPFKVRLSFLVRRSGCNAVIDPLKSALSGTIIVSDSLSTSFDCSECTNFMFDQDITSKTVANYKGKTLPWDVTIRLNKQAVGFQSYAFVLGGDCPNRDPANWTVYATYDYTGTTTDWEMIDAIDNSTRIPDDDASRRSKMTFIPRPLLHTYDAFKLSVAKPKSDWVSNICGSSMIQLTEFYPQICNLILCPIDYPYPATPAGQNATVLCDSTSVNYRTRFCNSEGVWEKEDASNCTDVNSSFTYPNNLTLTVNDFMKKVKPTIIGTVSNFRVNPLLPAGLQLSNFDGEISGFPTSPLIPAKMFEISADSVKGVLTQSISILIILPTCVDEEGAYETPINQMVFAPCPQGQSGKKSRECLAIIPPKWSPWNMENCRPGVDPQCHLTDSFFSFRINTEITSIIPVCEGSIKNVTIDFLLPSGLLFDSKTGTISGTPVVPFYETKYCLYFLGHDFGFSDVDISITVFAPITQCTFIYQGDLNLFVGQELHLRAPICDNPVQSFNATGLPKGVSILKNGEIIGIPTTIENCTVTVIAHNPIADQSFTIQLNIVSQIYTIGLMGHYTLGVYTTKPKPVEYDALWKDIDSGIIETEWAVFNGGSNWLVTTTTVTFGTSVVRSTYYLAHWKGFLTIPKDGDYQFSVVGDDALYLFLDDFAHSKGGNTDYAVPAIITVRELTSGIHPFGLMFYQYTGYHSLQLKWKIPGTTTFEFVPNNFLTYTPSTLTAFKYPKSDFIFIVGVPIKTITPDLQGSYTNIVNVNDFPSGITFSNGLIGGTPKSTFPRTAITIKCISETATIQDTIFFTIVALTKENLLQGLSGNYYTTSATINCYPFTDPSTDKTLILTYQRIIPTYYHPPSSTIWQGLSGSFAIQFFVQWDGFVDVNEAGDYSIQLSGESGILLKIGSTSFETGDCSISVTKQIYLESGLNPIVINYKKIPQRDITSVSIQWKLVASTSKLQEISNDVLYYAPSSHFTYEYTIANYIVNVRIAENPAIFFDIDSSAFNMFYSTPPLPSGLLLNTQTGTITGTPTTSSISSLYIITATSNTGGTSFTVSLQLSIEPYSPPYNLVYEDVKGIIGNLIETITPTIDNDKFVKYFCKDTLPQGLSLNSNDGSISGTPQISVDSYITIYCTNPSATINATVHFIISGCAGSYPYIQFDISIKSNELSILFLDAQKQIIINEPTGSLNPNTNYTFQQCISPGVAILDINSISSITGLFSIYLNGETLRVGEYKLGTLHYEINTQDQTPSIIEYTIPNPIYPAFTFVFYPTLKFGASSFTATGLPKTASIDLRTGVIQGSFTESITLSITGKTSKGLITPVFTLLITVISCPYSLLSLRIESGSSAQLLTVQLKNSQGVLLVDAKGLDKNVATSFNFCEAPGTITIILGKTDGSTWSDGSIAKILLDNQVIMSMTHSSGKSTTRSLSTETIVKPNCDWQISLKTPKGGWDNEYIENDEGWTVYKLSNLPVRTTITRYYRTKFTYTGKLSELSTLLIAITIDAGTIIRLNGNEFYRRHLPLTGVTDTFYAPSSFPDPKEMIITVAVHLLQQGENVLAVEVHNSISSPEIDPIKSFMLPIINQIEECQIRTLSSTLAITMEAETNAPNGGHDDTEGLQKSYDMDYNTKYCSGGINEKMLPLNVIYKWPLGIVEFFNTFEYVTANDAAYRDPTEFALYGSFDRDALEWIKVEEFTNFSMTTQRFTRVPFPMGKNIRSFEAYRIEILKVRDLIQPWPAIQFAEFLASNCKPKFCPLDGTWKETVGGNFAYLQCPEGSFGNKERLCETSGSWAGEINNCKAMAKNIIYPPLDFHLKQYNVFTPTIDGGLDGYRIDCVLPAGINFVTRNGEISGEPVNLLKPSTSCVVTGHGGENTITSSITVLVSQLQCLADGNWKTTNAGETTDISCGDGYSGLISRTCTNENPPKWGEPIRACTVLAPTMGFSELTFQFYVGDSVTIIPHIIAAEAVINITGNLPEGLSFNSTNGGITGKCLTVVAKTEVLVGCYNSAGKAEKTLTFSVISTLPPLIYGTTSFIFYIGFPVSSDPPTTIDPQITDLQINPTPPTGITVSANGVINSNITISEELKSNYVVRGTLNGKIIQSNALTIEVKQPRCPENGPEYPSTKAGDTITLDCPPGQSGKITRKCPKAINPVWENPISTCVSIAPTCMSDGTFPTTDIGKTASAPCPSGEIGTQYRICHNVSNIAQWDPVTNKTGCLKVNPSIKYSVIEMIIPVDTIITPNECTKTQIIGELTISPFLPYNLQFDKVSGKISGTPSQTITRTEYTVSGNGIDERRYSTQIYITITNTYATSIVYPTSEMSFYIGIPELNYPSPILNGLYKEISISPILPKGIDFSEAGKVSGTVLSGTIESDITYTVTVVVITLPSPTTTIKVKVIQPKCQIDVVDSITWGPYNAGETQTIQCGEGSEGELTRKCGEGKNPIWGNVVGQCNPKNPSFKYLGNPYTFFVNNTVTIKPSSVLNNPTSFTLNCNPDDHFPDLFFNTSNGVITGTASTIFSKTCNVIAANNHGQSNPVELKITIKKSTCPATGGYELAEVNEYSSKACPKYGLMFRLCLANGIWGIEDKSQCSETDFNVDELLSVVIVEFQFDAVLSPVTTKTSISVMINAISTTLSILPSIVYIPIPPKRLRELQNTQLITAYISTSNPEVYANTLSDPTTQSALKSSIRNSQKTSIFRNAIIVMNVEVKAPSSSKSKTGAIVGGVVGGLVFVLLVAMIILWFRHDRTLVTRKPSAVGIRVGSRAKTNSILILSDEISNPVDIKSQNPIDPSQIDEKSNSQKDISKKDDTGKKTSEDKPHKKEIETKEKSEKSTKKTKHDSSSSEDEKGHTSDKKENSHDTSSDSEEETEL